MTLANTRETWFRRPVTVIHQKKPDEDGKPFDIVCGYGRLEASVVLGERTIPAVIIETSGGKKDAASAQGEVA